MLSNWFEAIPLRQLGMKSKGMLLDMDKGKR